MEFKCENISFSRFVLFSFLFYFCLAAKQEKRGARKYENRIVRSLGQPCQWETLSTLFSLFSWLREQWTSKPNHPHRITGSGFPRATHFIFFPATR